MKNTSQFQVLNDTELLKTVGGNPLLIVGGVYAGIFVAGVTTGYLVNKR